MKSHPVKSHFYLLSLAFLLTSVPISMSVTVNQASAQISTGSSGGGGCSSSGSGGSYCGGGMVAPPVGSLTPTAAVYPIFGVPQPIGGGVFSVQAGRVTLNMWKGPSGYYYPYCGVPAGWNYYNVPIPVIVNPQYNPPSASDPPVSTFIADTTEFLDKKKKEKKISDRDYKNMSQRLKDLESKERLMRNQSGGTMDKTDEDQVRQEVAQVLKEMQWRLGRNEKY